MFIFLPSTNADKIGDENFAVFIDLNSKSANKNKEEMEKVIDNQTTNITIIDAIKKKKKENSK
jgi:hypothetical protein